MKRLQPPSLLRESLGKECLLLFGEVCREINVKLDDQVALLFGVWGKGHAFTVDGLDVTGANDFSDWDTQDSLVEGIQFNHTSDQGINEL